MFRQPREVGTLDLSFAAVRNSFLFFRKLQLKVDPQHSSRVPAVTPFSEIGDSHESKSPIHLAYGCSRQDLHPLFCLFIRGLPSDRPTITTLSWKFTPTAVMRPSMIKPRDVAPVQTFAKAAAKCSAEVSQLLRKGDQDQRHLPCSDLAFVRC